jgi:hypothetical protein
MVYWVFLLLVMVVGGLFATTKASIPIIQRIVPIRSITTVQQHEQQRRRRFPYISINSLSSLRSASHGSVITTTNVKRSVANGSTVINTDQVVTSPIQIFLQTILNSRKHLIAAAVARSTSIFIMYPADVIKTRLQMQQVNALRITGLFNGVIGSLVGQVPYGVLTFGSYEMYKSYFLEHLPSTIPPVFKYAAGKYF